SACEVASWIDEAAAFSRSVGRLPGAGSSDCKSCTARLMISDRSLGSAASRTSETAFSMMAWTSAERDMNRSAIISGLSTLSTSEISDYHCPGLGWLHISNYRVRLGRLHNRVNRTALSSHHP